MRANLQDLVDKGLLSQAQATREALRHGQAIGMGDRIKLRLFHGVSTSEQEKRVRRERRGPGF
jgi:hypothetical protein